MVTRRPTDQPPSLAAPLSAGNDFSKLTDPKFVLDNEIKEWHFYIYFNTTSPTQRAAALSLRTAILALRTAGVFAAVPLARVNTAPIGPHPAGSYEVWVPRESFATVFSFLALNHGALSVLVHPLTREERADHSSRKAWIGEPWRVLLEALEEVREELPLQYSGLSRFPGEEKRRRLMEIGMGYSSTEPGMTREERERWGRELGEKVKCEEGAA